ncbi:phosphopantetheine-binding protein, partial [Methylomicrobium sp. RS1]|uniref:phosphopantetheine-binding protein n=1 Tax=Candidatus Methylomicrobium oryzae TaxID=2802053 RepID=UPI001921E732
GVEQVGLDDNFFELGGHSLLATRMVARIRELMKTDLSLAGVFETKSLAELAALASQAGDAEIDDAVLTEMGDWLDELEMS